MLSLDISSVKLQLRNEIYYEYLVGKTVRDEQVATSRMCLQKVQQCMAAARFVPPCTVEPHRTHMRHRDKGWGPSVSLW